VSDGFVSKLDSSLTSLISSTYLGGSAYYYGDFVVTLSSVDSLGNIYVAGYTASSDFPVTTGAYDTSFNGISDIFVAKLNMGSVDSIPPTTTASLSGTSGNNDWYTSDVQVTLTATDNEGGSGVNKTEYSFDNSTWSTYLSSFTINNEGTTTVYYKSTDNAGNVEPTKNTSVKIDKTPPTISATTSPSPNANGWNNTDVTVTFTCDDATSGIASCTPATTVTTEGAGQVITGEAVDNAGNTASASVTLNIDKTPPTVTVSATPNTLWPPNHKMVDVTIDGSATDDMSGIASVVITVTDEYGLYDMTVSGFGSTIQLEAWRKGTDKDGRVYTITVVATDNAGNQSTATTTVIVPHDMRDKK
jgi:hypothetical protein